MNPIYEILGVFIAGTIFGVVIVRYSIGLSTKWMYQLIHDVPLEKLGENIDQAYTGEDEEITE